LAAELKIPGEFVCCELSELPSRLLRGDFDVIFASVGVLWWMPDLGRWAQVVAHFLSPGGVFYIHEFHPFGGVFDDEQPPGSPPRLRYPYFHSVKPMEFPPVESGDYADPEAHVNLPHFEWSFSMSDIINSLIAAGLRIDFLHEFDYSTYQSQPFLKRGKDGMWRYEDAPKTLPLMFSLRATKP